MVISLWPDGVPPAGPLPWQGATNTRGHPSACAELRPGRAISSVLSCTAWGLSCLLPYGRSGELLPRLFTLARPLARPSAVCFLCHFPSRRHLGTAAPGR